MGRIYNCILCSRKKLIIILICFLHKYHMWKRKFNVVSSSFVQLYFPKIRCFFPSRSKYKYDTANNLTPSPPIHEPGDDEDDEYYLLRSFSINSKGAIINKGDFIRQRSRSNNSVASNTSSYTPGASYSSGGQSRGPTSKVQILGASDVGKTTLVNQFMTSEYMNAYETQGWYKFIYRIKLY